MHEWKEKLYMFTTWHRVNWLPSITSTTFDYEMTNFSIVVFKKIRTLSYKKVDNHIKVDTKVDKNVDTYVDKNRIGYIDYIDYILNDDTQDMARL